LADGKLGEKNRQEWHDYGADNFPNMVGAVEHGVESYKKRTAPYHFCVGGFFSGSDFIEVCSFGDTPGNQRASTLTAIANTKGMTAIARDVALLTSHRVMPNIVLNA
jgi:hypothetical protein